MSLLLLLDSDAGPASGYVVSFPAVAPRPRFDGVAWSTVTLDEGPTSTGPWTQLLTSTLRPLDADAAAPAERDITLRGAQLEVGWYRITFRDTGGLASPVKPIYNGDAWAPTLQDIADLCTEYTRQRIDDQGPYAGAETGGFSSNTDPTADTVRGFIRAAVQEVAGRVGVPIPAKCLNLAKTAASWHAAAQVDAKRSGGSDEADSSFRWKQNSYIATLNELVEQARPRALNLS